MSTPPTPQHDLSTLHNIIKSTPISEIAPGNDELIVLESDDSVRKALELLIKNQIFSAPVQTPKGKYIGIVSALDIMTFIIDLFSEEDDTQKTRSLFEMIAQKNSKYIHSTVSHVLDHNAETSEPYESVSRDDSVESAMDLFARGLHRLIIVNDNGEPVGMLTLAAIIKFLTNKLGVLGTKTIRELKLGSRPVITVSKDTKTIDAFAIMRQKQISGVGVVDSRSALIGNLSSRDLNTINDASLYHSMFQPVGAFISNMKQNVVEEVQPLISVGEDTKLSYVLSRMSGNRIHRIYITDVHQKPLGVVSMRDIIRTVLNQVRNA